MFPLVENFHHELLMQHVFLVKLFILVKVKIPKGVSEQKITTQNCIPNLANQITL